MKIAIFYTDHANDWTAPNGSFVDMAKKLLVSSKPSDISGDEYVVYDIYEGEIPSVGQLKQDDVQGIFITGSRYDSFNMETDWINRLRLLLVQVLQEGQIPTVGICFGHQIVAHALGCVVGRNPLGLEAGLHPVKLNSLGQELFPDQDDGTLVLSELHSDIVTDVPEGCRNWGDTELCALQGFYKHNQLLTFQGHPEFVTETAKNGLVMSAAKLEPQKLGDWQLQTEQLSNQGVFAGRTIWNLYRSAI